MMQAFYETGLYEEKTNDGIDNGAKGTLGRLFRVFIFMMLLF